MDTNPSRTQRDESPALVAELCAVGFGDAEEIGRGGFGIVYRCRQPELDRTVAVKVLTGALDRDRERFLREQRAMGRLTGHPNIVGVFQVGETEQSHPYLVMEYHQRDSLDAQLCRHGPLPLEQVLRLGVKIAGALETAHCVGVLHRDVKPGNILFTDYGEPALSDFGIAHIPGGFETATGTFTGSPAFTAPEIVSGEPPTTASDVYGLGATLFAALTGHAAFERRVGERIVTQFLRIATESAPDLRDRGIPDDMADAVERAMSHDSRNRPAVVAFAEELQQIQRNHGFAVDQMALRSDAQDQQPVAQPMPTAGNRPTIGNLPLELSSFVGRTAELTQLKNRLSQFRLVTLTGFGGVGKTRLALRAAHDVRKDFADGVWLVDLGELHDGSLLVDAVAAALGLRDQSARPLQDVVLEYMWPRELLLVLDNCEQVVDEVAKVAETHLRACERLRILATSREPLGISGESVLRLSPLACPDPDAEPTVRRIPGYDAVALFAERAAAAVPGFELTEQNTDTVARICSRLDGLPLAIELAAARLKAMSPEQILDRLSERYTVLNRGSRGAPARQQSLEWSIEWSYELCTPSEQQLWERLSVFAGSFDLEAAEHVCGDDLSPDDLVDLLSSLVDKSILIRTESDGVVRFRLLATVRGFGRNKLQSGRYSALRRRHYEWYQRLVADTKAEWFSEHQLRWLARLERELPNLREALEYSLSKKGGEGLEFAADVMPFWVTRGLLSEGRRILDRALADTPPATSGERAQALYAVVLLAGVQGDLPAVTARGAEARALVDELTDPTERARAAIADGFSALLTDDAERGRATLEAAIGIDDDPVSRVLAMLLLGRAHELRGDLTSALSWYEKVLAISEPRGESMFTANALWSIGIARWRLGERDEAARRLRRGLELAQNMNDRRTAAECLEVLAWIAMENDDPRFAVVLMGASDAFGRAVGSAVLTFRDLIDHHEACERHARDVLGETEFASAHNQGGSMAIGEAVAYALSGSGNTTGG